MPILGIKQFGGEVEVSFGGRTERRPFPPSLSPQDAEDIRWYLEDYLVYPLDPAPTIAERIERRIKKIGEDLFKQVLDGTKAWHAAADQLGDTRIEIGSEVQDAGTPWELLRDPETDSPLALGAAAFVRSHSRAAKRARPKEPDSKDVRILLAICRPGGAADVPFRSVARRLIKGLSEEARQHFTLEVLRPPTFEALGRKLLAAKKAGKPYHVLRFDGHGSPENVQFENPDIKGNAQPVPAAKLGELLNSASVPVLILNACRSAFAEPPKAPLDASDVHQQIRTFGSLAHSVMDHGAAAVVAWRYNVYVATAAQFVADFYAALASGLTVGEASSLARNQLNNAVREIEDWIVPVVYEASPVRLFPQSHGVIELKLDGDGTKKASGLPQAPDIGFIGRDETILALDRMFDSQSVVLLHAYAGNGKTSKAVEFARWWQQTGFAGPVLFTSFEQPKKLREVLDQLGQMFEGLLAKQGIQWLTLTDEQRRGLALQILKQVPVLWIWDNVESINEFSGSTLREERGELLDFLKGARGTKAKFLLSSRRDERDWLHDLPGRVHLPPMMFEDRLDMAKALGQKHGKWLEDVEDWYPLLRFTQGNPLTLTVLVGQALRDGLRMKQQIEAFVRRLQTGEAAFEDEASEGRERSLAASLAYGFEAAFTEAERKQLAPLYLFQGFVAVDALRAMDKSLTRETGIELLDRAAEVGLLTALGNRYYGIHPALPWFFRRLFEQYNGETREAAERTFVEAVVGVGNSYRQRYDLGKRDVISLLALEEANLLRARSLARRRGWWGLVTSVVRTLVTLYEHRGRRADRNRLVEEIVPDFIDPRTDRPLAGREDAWTLLTGYRVRVAQQSRRWAEAQRLQMSLVDWSRKEAAETLLRAPRVGIRRPRAWCGPWVRPCSTSHKFSSSRARRNASRG